MVVRQDTKSIVKRSLLLAIIVECSCMLGFYLALMPRLAMPLYNAIIFHPQAELDDLSSEIKKVENYCHCQFSDVYFKAPDGENLHGWCFAIPGATKTILFSHGNGGNIQNRLALCPLLLKTGCSVFLYDYEGYGKSSPPSLPAICQDGVAAFDYLVQNRHLRPADIVLYGESIGCGVTSELSRERQSGGIILQSPFTSMRDCACDKLPLLRLYPACSFPPPLLDNLQIMRSTHAPLLIIHGMKDSILPYNCSERIAAQAKEPITLVLLPNAGHNDIYSQDLQLTFSAVEKFIAHL